MREKLCRGLGLKLFEKTIEIYDGNWCSHYICPFGSVLVGIGVFLFPATLVVMALAGPSFMWGLLASGAFFVTGSVIGKEPQGGWR